MKSKLSNRFSFIVYTSTITFYDGFKDVDITIYPIEFDTDKDPIIRGKKDAE